jgi:3-phenylpropionate/trans-cinnamate dioxygenase ferredoxin subunit
VTEGDSVTLDVSDLGPGSKRPVQLGGRRLLVCNVAGAFFAVDEGCSHAASSLAGGRLSGFELECPLHGARFDVRDGRPTRRPALRPIGTHSIVVEQGVATVRLEDGS